MKELFIFNFLNMETQAKDNPDYKKILSILLGDKWDEDTLRAVEGTCIKVQDLLDTQISEMEEVQIPEGYDIGGWKPHIRHHNDVHIDYTGSTKVRQQRVIQRTKADILRQTKKQTKIISDLHSLIIYRVKEVLGLPENLEKLRLIPPYYIGSQYSIHINSQLIDALKQKK